MTPTSHAFEDKAFLWLLLAVSVAFAVVLWPFFAAVLWATAFAILFSRLNRRITRALRGSRNWGALATLLLVVGMVIIPLIAVGAMLAQEAATVVAKMRSGEIDFGRYARQIYEALPAWATGLLERLGLGDFTTIQERVSASLLKGGQLFAGQLLAVGQNTLDFVVSLFVMLYLLFFLLRDGRWLMHRVGDSVPLRPEQRRALLTKFNVVVRATVKGNIVVAMLQGALGGLIFWLLGINAPLLWGVLMGILSLLPAVGTALVWGPVALYFLATGQVVQGVVLLAYGVLVIGLVDNIVRPILVGKDTKMPDYVVLITTLGGMAVFGINGFLIGPLVAAMFIAAWDIFSESRRPGGEGATSREP